MKKQTFVVIMKKIGLTIALFVGVFCVSMLQADLISKGIMLK